MSMETNNNAGADAEKTDAERLRSMPSHIVYVEAPDDAGQLMRVGAMFMHKSGAGWALRLDRNQTARELVLAHGDDLVVLQNRRRLELAERVTVAGLKEKTFESFDEAAHPYRERGNRQDGTVQRAGTQADSHDVAPGGPEIVTRPIGGPGGS